QRSGSRSEGGAANHRADGAGRAGSARNVDRATATAWDLAVAGQQSDAGHRVRHAETVPRVLRASVCGEVLEPVRPAARRATRGLRGPNQVAVAGALPEPTDQRGAAARPEPIRVRPGAAVGGWTGLGDCRSGAAGAVCAGPGGAVRAGAGGGAASARAAAGA